MTATIINLNHDWRFSKHATSIPDALPLDWEPVSLPHTWNAADGQDGGNDYYRGVCHYVRFIHRSDLPPAERYYLELRGANSSADVWLNGQKLAHHDGGYSAWRVDLTDAMQDENLLVIAVDNAPNDHVYPQMADFTFYGGLYRDVLLHCVPESHIDLEYFGGSGLMITPKVIGKDADVDVEVFVCNRKPGQSLRYTIQDDGATVAQLQSDQTRVRFHLDNVHLWHGRKDPHLYTARVELREGGECIDCRSVRFGCRSFEIDPERGFILNGEDYPLHGVSRHQDRKGVGNALLPEHHLEDMDLICEVGANTIRLAHYQHDQFFYDLCDERGMVVWAEIPYISSHLPAGRENTFSQMRELIVQNYNHPSIVVWGLSNEITINGSDPDLLENHRLLNELCHQMDPTRKTVIACVSPCSIEDPYLRIPDAVSYNHYFGWYGGDTSMNGPWFDRFHAAHPDLPIGCSEYGCEALNWHTSNPVQGDYTEEYQAYYHEELIKQLFTRKFIWATHVWNMFDFGADARSEGGENGQNHKGLVTFDRKYKKDSFYAYKAWLSDEPFVHICGKRYVDRVEDMTRVTVYSNLPEVELFANGVSLGRQRSDLHFFYFDVPNAGETRLTAVAGEQRDVSVIRKVDVFNEAYRLKDEGAILNWFDITTPDGFFSLNDRLSDILAVPEGSAVLSDLFSKMSDGGGFAGFELSGSEGMMNMLGGFTVIRLSGMMGAMGVKPTREDLLDLNARLNRIPKP